MARHRTRRIPAVAAFASAAATLASLTAMTVVGGLMAASAAPAARRPADPAGEQEYAEVKTLAGTRPPEAADDEAYRLSIVWPVHLQVRFLLESIGPRYTAAALGLADARPLRRWLAQNAKVKERVVRERLPLLFRITYVLTAVYGPDAAALFLQGQNRRLDDRAPLMVLAAADHPADVQGDLLQAVRSFIMG